MKKILFLFVTLNLLSHVIFSQTTIPLSRTDSAAIKENNSIYEEYLNKGDKKEASRRLDLNAVIYWKHNYYNQAVDYYSKSLKLNEQLGNQNGIAGINSNLALIYADNGDYQKAFDFFEKTLAVRKSKKESIGIISALINESVVLNKMSRFDEAVKKLEEALTYAREINDEAQMRSVFGMLSETYQKAGNNKKAMYYYEFYKTFNDYVTDKVVAKTQHQLSEEILQKQVLELENENKQLELEKQDWVIIQQSEKIGIITEEQQKLVDSLSKQEMALEIVTQRSRIQELENFTLTQEKKLQKTVIIIISIVLLIVIGLLFWLLIIYRQKKRINEELISKNSIINQQKEEISTQNEQLLTINEVVTDKNNQITSSITYAQKIQYAILSGSDKLVDLVADSFLVYYPRDIVSGDFYFFKKVDNQKIIVVGDCTGHGVPGAFLTVLGSNILNSIIFDKNIIEPHEILTELDNQFLKMINQGDDGVHDGMDVSICLIDEENTNITFATARNSPVIVANNEIKRINATRRSIGEMEILKHIKKKDFESVKIKIEQDAWIYMFSDGIIDMFNTNNEKYTRKRLFDNFTEMIGKNGQQQQLYFDKITNNWLGDEKQIDDIILIGFQIKK